LQRCHLVVAVRTLSAIAGVTRTSGSADRTLAFAGRCRTPWSCQKSTGSRKYKHASRRSCGPHGEGPTGWLLVAFGRNWLHAACCIIHGACCIMHGACCCCVVGFMSHVAWCVLQRCMLWLRNACCITCLERAREHRLQDRLLEVVLGLRTVAQIVAKNKQANAHARRAAPTTHMYARTQTRAGSDPQQRADGGCDGVAVVTVPLGG
jgi:hypothetical protein